MKKQVKVKRLQGSPYAIEYDIAGRGASSTIVKAYNLDNLKEELVSKIVSINEEQNSGVYKVELQILKELPNHPNLVNYKKVQISSENNLYFIMQFCNGGNLEKYMYDNKYVFSEEKIWFFLKQFCDGYKVLYEHSLLHRDIKPENILIHNGDFKIADFGLSKLMKDPQVIENVSAKGTPIYMAPQLPESKEGNSKVDVFSLGVLLYRLSFKGQYPFFDQGRKYRSIGEYFRQLKIRKLIVPTNQGRSEELIVLIKRMLQKSMDDRIGWKEIFQHPKIVKAFRAERKKQITSMEQFKKSLIFVNKSITKLQQFDTNCKESEQKQKDGCLILEEAFNKTGKSSFERKLYRFKLIYTLIEYTNGKLKGFTKAQSKIHKHIKNICNQLILKGLQFSLFVINSLRNISGQWQAFSQLQITNFENIFDNDRVIIQQQLTKMLDSTDSIAKSLLKVKQGENGKQFCIDNRQVIKNSYEDRLYTYLTEYWEYPSSFRTQLLTSTILLVDIYDLVTKFQRNDLHYEPHILQQVQDEDSKAFYQYLMDSQSQTEQALKKRMDSCGLIII